MSEPSVKIGDSVTYRCMSLRTYTGKVESISGQIAGVRWRGSMIVSDEYIPNLAVLINGVAQIDGWEPNRK